MVEVFGIPMIATAKWSTTMLNHVASVLAELIDNDNDGCADDPKALKELLEKSGGKKAVVLWDKKHPVSTAIPLLKKAGFKYVVDEGFSETKLGCSGLKFTKTCSDASIEELFHLVTIGLSEAHPKIFGAYWEAKSTLTNAMDIARYTFFADIFNLFIVVYVHIIEYFNVSKLPKLISITILCSTVFSQGFFNFDFYVRFLLISELVAMGRTRFPQNIQPRLGITTQIRHASTVVKQWNTSGGVTVHFLVFVLAVREVSHMRTNSNI